MCPRKPSRIARSFSLRGVFLARVLFFVVLLSGGSFAEISDEIFERVQFGLTDHLLISNNKPPGDPDSDSQSFFLHENLVSGEYRNYEVAIRFANRLTGTESLASLSRPFVLEKKTARARLGGFEIQAGDTHQELGRGILLSLYRDEVFGIDNTIEGGAVGYRSERFESNVFGGRVQALQAPVAINPLAYPLTNRNVYLFGSGIRVRPTAIAELGFHGLYGMQQPTEALSSGNFDKTWAGAGISFHQPQIWADADLYAETDVLWTQLPEAGESGPRGHATYGSLSWAPLPWKAKAEFKDYRDFRFDFRRPPNFEEDVVSTMNTENVTAGRVTIERKFTEMNASFLGSGMVGQDKMVGSNYYHGVLGSKFVLPWGNADIELRSGYRNFPGVSDLVHARIIAKLRTWPGQAIEFYAQRALNRKVQLDTKEDRTQLRLSYTFSPQFFAGLGYEYVPTYSSEMGQHFWNLSASLTLGSLVARTLIGQTSGGTQCSGGVCRQIPPYSGALLETTYRF